MELLLAALLGVGCGIVTGLTPGIHVNLVCSLLWAALPILPVSPPAFVVFIVTIAITHTFLDAIPSVFLGAPDDAHAMGVLPGHRYLLRGWGIMAVKLSTIGALSGLVLGTLTFTAFGWLTTVCALIPNVVFGWILLAIPVVMLLRERRKAAALTVVVLGSVLGAVGFRYPNPLFPMLSGVFGSSMLVYSLRERVVIPVQDSRAQLQLRWKDVIRAAVGGLLAGGLTAILPGLSAAHASVIGMLLAAGTGDHGFLVLTGAIGTTNFFLSLAAYAAIGKPRNGALVTAATLAPGFPASIAIAAALFAGGMGCILVLLVSRGAARIMPKLPYATLSASVVIMTVCLVWVLNGLAGVVMLAVSTAIGLLTASAKCARAHAMSCILVPVGLRFLGVPV